VLDRRSGYLVAYEFLAFIGLEFFNYVHGVAILGEKAYIWFL
jgi:hypothetical protein